MRVQRWIAMTMVMAACGVALAHESPVDHVHRILRMSAQRLDENDLVVVSYRMVLPERAALLQLKAMDQDGDGKISEEERDAFFKHRGEEIAKQLQMSVDDKPVAVTVAGKVVLDPVFGQTFVFEARVPKLAAGVHKGKLVDLYSQRYPGPYVWRASTATPGTGATTQPALTPMTLKVPAIGDTQASQGSTIVLTFELIAPG